MEVSRARSVLFVVAGFAGFRFARAWFPSRFPWFLLHFPAWFSLRPAVSRLVAKIPMLATPSQRQVKSWVFPVELGSKADTVLYRVL